MAEHNFQSICCLFVAALLFPVAGWTQPQRPGVKSVSGIYPHLAMYNQEGECGTGVVVPWAGRLWTLTYGPHLPFGSSDKLYEITHDLEQVAHSESVGGTPANRMIHPESNQLFIGPYAIDANGNVRVIPYSEMPGRHTGNARHLTDPANRIYYGTMEEGFYEVDVHTLKPTWLYADENLKEGDKRGTPGAGLIGWHGKGMYSGQGVLVYSNNGERGKQALEEFGAPSGGLSEWNGKSWKLIRRMQFTEVTGPGGIHGNPNPETDPIWTIGWDHRSLVLGVRDRGSWHFYRLPKASHCYDGAHGWNTEWPRIRNIGTETAPDYLMTMHGMFWRFPGSFTSASSAGIRPRSAYLKVIGDFTRWGGGLVFGCDDSAQREFLNKRKAKGDIEGPGQSNSNLWFTSPSLPDELGPTTAEGAVWLADDVTPDVPSEPFLFAGWPKRMAWLQNESDRDVKVTFEVDARGTGDWAALNSVVVPAKGSLSYFFSEHQRGEWIRARVDAPARLSLQFSYTDVEDRDKNPDGIFTGLRPIFESTYKGGLLYGLGNDRRALGLAATTVSQGISQPAGYYELDENLKLVKKADDSTETFIRERFAIPKEVVTIDGASVLVVDDKGRRWRLPFGHAQYTDATREGELRICREVATERDLFSCHGTFYELPAENADGYAKIRPVASHPYGVQDYASYRGMLVMTGINPKHIKGDSNEHVIVADDGAAAVWVGAIDDLWKLGKPVGQGGPWNRTQIEASIPSDPYLIAFYDKRSLRLLHDSEKAVTFTLQADPTGQGMWVDYKRWKVAPGEHVDYVFPEAFQARWIRLISDTDCRATARLTYE